MFDDGQITGGKVHYLRRVKTGDYEHADVNTELSFVVRDGSDYRDILDTATTEAQQNTLRMLGLSKGAVRAAIKKPPVVVEDKSKTISEPGTEEKTAVLATADEDPLADPLATGPSVSGGTTTETSGGKPTLSEDPLADPALSNSVSATAAPASAGDPAAIPEGDEWTAEREVTDKDLTDACTRKNAVLIGSHKEKGSQMIRALIAKFAPAGQPARAIPAAQRAAFLQALEALK